MIKGQTVIILSNLNVERSKLNLPGIIGDIEGKEVSFIEYDGTHKDSDGKIIRLCRVEGISVRRENDEAEVGIHELLIPETSLNIKEYNEKG